jgi:hypothetical protein
MADKTIQLKSREARLMPAEDEENGSAEALILGRLRGKDKIVTITQIYQPVEFKSISYRNMDHERFSKPVLVVEDAKAIDRSRQVCRRA